MYASYLLFMLLVLWTNPTLQQRCHTRELYMCCLPSLLNSRKSVMPRDNSSLTYYCKVWGKSWECRDNYFSKCVADVHNMVSEVVVGESRRIYKELCESNSKTRKDLVKHLPCSSDALTMSIQKCTDNLENIIHMIYSQSAEDRVNSGCCYFQRWYQCFKQNLDKLCEKGALEEILPSYNFFHLETVDKICSHYDPEGEICVAYLNREVPPPSEASSYIARLASQFLRSLQ